MDAQAWVALAVGIVGAIAWMTSMWIRAGRILQKIDDFQGTQSLHTERLYKHDTRITRLEIKTENL